VFRILCLKVYYKLITVDVIVAALLNILNVF